MVQSIRRVTKSRKADSSEVGAIIHADYARNPAGYRRRANPFALDSEEPQSISVKQNHAADVSPGQSLTDFRDVFANRIRKILGVEIDRELITGETANVLFRLAKDKMQSNMNRGGRRLAVHFQRFNDSLRSLKKLTEIINVHYPF